MRATSIEGVKCPHCLVAVNESWSPAGLGQEQPGGLVGGFWQVYWMNCPECGRSIIQLQRAPSGYEEEEIRLIAWPRSTTRPVAPEVEARYAQDFTEAVAVLPLSPKASAAISRRMLQDIMREKGGIKKKTLDAEIQEVIDTNAVPAWLAGNLDAVRVVGNFAAHPIKSENSGGVVEVEPGEAEWLLDVLEGLFEFYFVQPEQARKRREALNEKLRDAGKPELKEPSK